MYRSSSSRTFTPTVVSFAQNLLIALLAIGIITPVILSVFNLKTNEKCNAVTKIKSYLWSGVFILSLFFLIWYLSSNVLLIGLLFSLALYVQFYGVDDAFTRCTDFATSEVCDNINRFAIPKTCSISENIKEETSCDREKWERGYTAAFFPLCKLGEINSNQTGAQFSYKCSESGLLSLLAGFSIIGVFITLIQNLG